ncbi:MAG: biotin/lipoyl-containing protein, partial [Blastocatellia bacterium]
DKARVRYELEIDSHREFIEIDNRDGKVTASIEGRAYDLDVASPEPGVYLFFLDDQVYEARTSRLLPRSYEVRLRGQSYSVKLVDRKHVRITGEPGDAGQQLLTAPMPGKVVKILLEAGEEVAAGQGVLIVEAMKMQNEVKSSKTGRITEIRVKEGATVTANQVLAVVE